MVLEQPVRGVSLGFLMLNRNVHRMELRIVDREKGVRGGMKMIKKSRRGGGVGRLVR